MSQCNQEWHAYVFFPFKLGWNESLRAYRLSRDRLSRDIACSQANRDKKASLAPAKACGNSSCMDGCIYALYIKNGEGYNITRWEITNYRRHFNVHKTT